MNPKHITSSSNIAVKEAARLKRKRNRHASGLFLAEGEDLLDAALGSGVLPRQVFVLEGFEGRVDESLTAALNRPRRAAAAANHGRAEFHRPEFYACNEHVMSKLSELGSGTRVISVFDFLHRPLPGDAAGSGPDAGPFLFLAGVGDPGNVGTLIRSAAALGSRGVILDPETADPYSSKALRATMGSIFQIRLSLDVPAGELVAWAVGLGLKIVGADAHKGTLVWDADLAGDYVLGLGAERGGLPSRLKAAAQEIVKIPQSPKSESINVAMAGTAVLYEALRQRRSGA